MMGKISSLCIALLCFLAACSDEEKSGEKFPPTDYTVKGKVEKGPFIKGSTITLQPLNAKMNPLGTSYPATIVDNEGTFDMGTVKLDAPYALLITDGFFYDEVRGSLSNSKITLEAIVDLKSQSTVNVNLLTHLAKERIKALIANGSSFRDANKQAQKELITNFGLQKYAEKDVAQFSITAGTNEAAALLVVSAAMLKDRSEAELTEYLAQLSWDFAANGKFTNEQKVAYRKATLELNYSAITDNVKERYKESGKNIEVKDLSHFVDYDGNGIAGDELGDPDTPLELAFEQTTLNVPKEGGVYKIKIRANVPYSLTDPLDRPTEEVFESLIPFFHVKIVDYEKSLNKQDNEITIEVKPAESFLLKDEEIKLYSMDGNIRSTLTIHQEGDPLNVMSDGDILSMVGNALKALSYLHTLEGVYTKTYTLNPSDRWYWMQYAPVSVGDSNLGETWTLSYIIIQNILRADWTARTLTESGKYDMSFVRPYLSCIRAAMFYEMSILWGNLPYIEELDRPHVEFYPPVPLERIFEHLEYLLQQNSVFSDKKNDYSSIQNMIFVSKDVPTALLAKIYMYRNDYSNALKLLEDIINKGYYQLENSRLEVMDKESSEMIYGFPLSISEENKYQYPSKFILGLNDDFMPIVTYTEVLLSAAECAKAMKIEEKANSYLNKVLTAKGLPTSGNFNTDLKEAWKSELKGTGTYFAFLKRNGIAMDELGLDNENWLILPIPSNELSKLSNLKQNPGY